jgi:hypothetical protein
MVAQSSIATGHSLEDRVNWVQFPKEAKDSSLLVSFHIHSGVPAVPYAIPVSAAGCLPESKTLGA